MLLPPWHCHQRIFRQRDCPITVGVSMRESLVHSNPFFFQFCTATATHFLRHPNDHKVVRFFIWRKLVTALPCANGNAKVTKKDEGCQHLRNGGFVWGHEHLHNIPTYLVFPIHYTSHPSMIPLYSTGRDSNTMHTLCSSHGVDIWSHLMCIAGRMTHLCIYIYVHHHYHHDDHDDDDDDHHHHHHHHHHHWSENSEMMSPIQKGCPSRQGGPHTPGCPSAASRWTRGSPRRSHGWCETERERGHRQGMGRFHQQNRGISPRIYRIPALMGTEKGVCS